MARFHSIQDWEALSPEQQLAEFEKAGIRREELVMASDLPPDTRRLLEAGTPVADTHYFTITMNAAGLWATYCAAIRAAEEADDFVVR
jgi:hypothetical protein